MAGQGFVSRTSAVAILLGCLILGVLIGLSSHSGATPNDGSNLRAGNVEQRRVESVDAQSPKPAEDEAQDTLPKGLPAGKAFPSLMSHDKATEAGDLPNPTFDEWQAVWKNNQYFNVLDEQFDQSFSFSYTYTY